MAIVGSTPGVAALASADTVREPGTRYYNPYRRTQSWLWIAAQDTQGPGVEIVGGGSTATYPGAGVLAEAHPDTGLVDVTVWWPFATTLRLYRVNVATGERSRVRGANLMRVRPTRVNRATNPDLLVDADGYLPGVGTPVVARRPDEVTRSGSSPSATRFPSATTFPGGDTSGSGFSGTGYVARVTAPAAGLTGVYLPGEVDARVHTVALELRLPASFDVTDPAYLQVAWSDVAGGTYAPTTVALSDLDKARALGRRDRVVLRVRAPAGATLGVPQLVAQLDQGEYLTVRRVLIEPSADSDGSYFDGRVLIGEWNGAPGESTSSYAPQGFALDREAPIGQPVVYEVSNPDVLGGLIAGTPVTLEAPHGHYDTWLSHPDGRMVKVWVERAPARTRAARVSYLEVIGASEPIAVTNGPRRSPTGDALRLITTSHAERAELAALFDDQSPLLVRMPASHGYGPGFWAQFGDETESPRTHWGVDGIRPLSYPFQQIAPPVTVGSVGSGTTDGSGFSVPPMVADSTDALVLVTAADTTEWMLARLMELGYRGNPNDPAATMQVPQSVLYMVRRGG